MRTLKQARVGLTCCVFHALIRCTTFYKDQQMQCAFYNIAHQSGPRIFYVPHSTALRSMYSTFLSLILINILFFKP